MTFQYTQYNTILKMNFSSVGSDVFTNMVKYAPISIPISSVMVTTSEVQQVADRGLLRHMILLRSVHLLLETIAETSIVLNDDDLIDIVYDRLMCDSEFMDTFSLVDIDIVRELINRCTKCDSSVITPLLTEITKSLPTV